MTRLEEKLKEMTEEYNSIRKTLVEIDNHIKDVGAKKDKLLTKGLELQGAIKALKELIPKSVESDIITLTLERKN